MINENTYITQWKFLLWSDKSPWIDMDDAAIEDTADAVKREYLVPNGIHALDIGKLEDRTYWVRACPDKSSVSDFYSEGEPGSEDNLSWHTFYTFTTQNGTDCISANFEYITQPIIRDTLKVCSHIYSNEYSVNNPKKAIYTK